MKRKKKLNQNNKTDLVVMIFAASMTGQERNWNWWSMGYL